MAAPIPYRMQNMAGLLRGADYTPFIGAAANIRAAKQNEMLNNHNLKIQEQKLAMLANEQAMEQQRRSALADFAMNPDDPNAFAGVAQADPEFAISHRQASERAAREQTKAQGEAWQDAFADMAGAADMILDSDDPMKTYSRMLPTLRKAHPGIDLEDPEDITEEQLIEEVQGIKYAFGTLANKNSPKDVQTFQYYESLSPEKKREFLKVKRNEQFLNLGDRFVQPGAPGEAPVQEFEKGVSPDQSPELKGKQEAAKTKSKAEAEKVANRSKVEAKIQAQRAKNDRLNSTIDKAIEEVGVMTAGPVGSFMSEIPGTSARDLRATIDTVKSNVGFDALQEMRDNSPTGGALGQVAVRELELLQAQIANLEQSQTPEQLRENLAAVKQANEDSWARIRDAYQKDYGTSLDGAPDIANMSLEELGTLDPASLTPQQREAAANRWDELQ